MSQSVIFLSLLVAFTVTVFEADSFTSAHVLNNANVSTSGIGTKTDLRSVDGQLGLGADALEEIKKYIEELGKLLKQAIDEAAHNATGQGGGNSKILSKQMKKFIKQELIKTLRAEIEDAGDKPTADSRIKNCRKFKQQVSNIVGFQFKSDSSSSVNFTQACLILKQIAQATTDDLNKNNTSSGGTQSNPDCGSACDPNSNKDRGGDGDSNTNMYNDTNTIPPDDYSMDSNNTKTIIETNLDIMSKINNLLKGNTSDSSNDNKNNNNKPKDDTHSGQSILDDALDMFRSSFRSQSSLSGTLPPHQISDKGNVSKAIDKIQAIIDKDLELSTGTD
ncbi:hypothetical protein PoB_007263900 [Plakobranchus ocellatus]|uniref:Uncharacterized protein n=1 Tax=Plakobranchus ocellatus TaxID=259542 RepID=A0AAV4DPJ0_9GAST|nr:hypothetical protein PoB_007263900 [Plakobranchus ocellatus]